MKGWKCPVCGRGVKPELETCPCVKLDSTDWRRWCYLCQQYVPATHSHNAAYPITMPFPVTVPTWTWSTGGIYSTAAGCTGFKYNQTNTLAVEEEPGDE